MQQRTRLIAARHIKGWSQEEAAAKVGVTRITLSQWERGISTPYPIHAYRLSELYGKSIEELGLQTASVANTAVTIDAPSDEFLEQIAVGITACSTLSDNGGRNEIIAATQIAATYVPILQTLLKSSTHRLQAAVLLSKIFQHQHGTAYHIGGVRQSLSYSEKSLEYARLSEDVTEVVVSLYQLASTYEWPLPPMSVKTCRKIALELMNEPVSLQEKHRDIVPARVQSWVYIGQSKILALNGLKQEAYTAIGKAKDVFPKGDSLPGLYFNEANLLRQESITYSYLSEQTKAVPAFLRLFDINDPSVAPTLLMHARTHLSVISETVFSLLKLPNVKKDKELTVHLWNAQFERAQALKSATYIKESQKTYEIMECIWPDDAGILALRDALFESDSIGFE